MSGRITKFVLLSLIVLASCSKEDSMDKKNIIIDDSQKTPLTPTQINAKIDQSINTKGTFNWKDASSHLLWSAVVNGNNVVTIGFGNSKTNIERAKTANSIKIQNELLAIVMRYEENTLDK